MALTKIKADGLTADLIDETKLADNSIDSEHYNDGSIDNAHLANNAVDTEEIADDAVTADKLANAINTDIAAKAVLTGSTNNTITTVTGANAIQGEANLTFDGTSLKVGASTSTRPISIYSASDAQIQFQGSGTGTGNNNADGFIVGNSGGVDATLWNYEDGYLRFATNNAESMRIDSSGRILIGTTTPGNSAADNLTIYDSVNAGITIRCPNDQSGLIYFSDGTSGAPEYAGFIQYTHGSDNKMYFGAGSATRFQVESNGNVKVNDGDLVIGTSGHGIDFSATGDSSGTTTSEILDEYEEGTWTGTIKYWDSSLGWHNAGFDTSPNNVTGLYSRIGRVVHVELYINGFDVNATATGSYAAISGLPFADTTSDNHYGVVSFAHDSCFDTAAGGAYIESSMIRPTNVGTTTSSTWKSSGPLYVMLSGTYEIN